jgi:hypothetical protein
MSQNFFQDTSAMEHYSCRYWLESFSSYLELLLHLVIRLIAATEFEKGNEVVAAAAM